MPRFKVIDPKGIPHDGEKTLQKGETFTDVAHSARVRAWLRFKQIEEVKDSTPPPADPPAGPDISEAARKLAEEKGIDLTKVTGTGANGAITKPDVEAAIAAAK